MSKTYDALLKAQREQGVHKKESIAHEPVPEPEVSIQDREAKQETPPLSTLPETEPKKPTIRPAFRHKRIINRVSIGSFVAKPDSLLAEQFRKLKSAITTHNLATSLRSVLVTSCMPEEGKTTVALNLSAIIAKGLDDSAILIDADLRKVSLTSILGLRNAVGLSDILEDRAAIEESLVDTEIEGLTILPGGVNPGNPAELIASTRMRNLIKQLKEKYRHSYIIIDSTPIISASEVNVLSLMVDGIIIVIMADKTRRDVVKRELSAINQEKILGVVLNCAEFETSDYYHKYYKHYGKEKE